MVELRALETRPHKMQQSVVATLEEALEKAKKGEFQGVAIVAVHSDFSIFRSWSDNECTSTLVGALHTCAHRILDSVA